jgi:subtilisin family serine protease
VATFAAVITAMNGAGAAPVPTRPIPSLTQHRLTPVLGTKAAGAIAGQYIVVLKDRAAAASAVQSTATSLTTRYGGTVKFTYTSTVRGYAAKMTEAQAAKLAASGDVAYVQQDRRAQISATQPNPPSWGLDRIDQQAFPLDHNYTYATTASNVHAYVIDTGIHIAHQDFGGRASYGFDFVDNDTTAEDCDPSLGTGHGTHVAGTIGGSTFGVAKGIQLVAVRVLGCDGSGSISQIIAGIDWVTTNAVKPAVANMSLGTQTGTDAALSDAVRRSIAAGITYAVAAGNQNIDACTRSPSDVTEAIVTGATEEGDLRASFSNTGSCVAVFAPGVDIDSAYFGDTTSDALASGTSMAAPHVAGAAALLLSAHPTWTPAQVRAGIVGGAVSGAVHNPGAGSTDKLLNIAGTTAITAPVSLLAHANNRYVTADLNVGTQLVTNRIGVGLWEQFDQVDAGGGQVAFKARANGKFVSADLNLGGTLVANRAAVGPWEKFTVGVNSDGTLNLKAASNNKFVTAEGAGSKSLIANRGAVGAWEKFDKGTPPGVVALIAIGDTFNSAVTAENAGNSPLIANRGAIGIWEEFEEVDAGNGFIALRSHANGMFVTADLNNGGTLIANRTVIGAWEKFRVDLNADATMSLFANANGKYVNISGPGAGPLAANVTNRNPLTFGPWEFFRIA